MYAEKLNAVFRFLSQKFPGLNIEQRYDSARGLEAFKIHSEQGALLLKLGQEFVNDNTIEQILGRLEQIDVAGTLVKEYALGVMVTSKDVTTFKRD